MNGKIQYSGGPWPFGMKFCFGRHKYILYSLYYEECEELGLLIDTPAMDEEGHFLWCTNVRKFKSLHKHLSKKLARLGVASGKGGTINVSLVIYGLRDSSEDPYFKREAECLSNTIVDYLNSLENDTDDQRAISLLENFSDTMFEGDSVATFYNKFNTNLKEMEKIISYSLYRILENSRIF